MIGIEKIILIILLVFFLIILFDFIIMLVRDYTREKELEKENYEKMKLIKQIEELGLPAYSILFFAKEEDLWKKLKLENM